MKKNITRLNAYAIATAILFLFPSCATIFTKSTYLISITSSPNGANISIADKKGKEVYQGITPATVELKSSAGYFSKAEYQVTLSYPGYEDQTIPVYAKLEGWYFGNILLGGLIGMLIIDPASGAMYKLDNKTPINVIFEKRNTNSTQTASKSELNILDINDIPDNIKEYLVKIN